jgi:hypothetical protein
MDFSSEREARKTKIKTDIAYYDFQTPENLTPFRSKILFETFQYEVSTSRINVKQQAGHLHQQKKTEMKKRLNHIYQGLPKVAKEDGNGRS